MSLIASIAGSGWGYHEEEKSFSFNEPFDSVEHMPLKAHSQSNLAFPFKQPSHTNLTFPNRVLAKQGSMRASSFSSSVLQPEELLGELSDWDLDAGGLSHNGTSRDLSVFSTSMLSRSCSKSSFGVHGSEIWNTDVKSERETLPVAPMFALNSPETKLQVQPKPEVVIEEPAHQAPPPPEVKREPQEAFKYDDIPSTDEQSGMKTEDYASESSSASPVAAMRDGPGKPPGGRQRDMGIRRVKQQCYRDLKKSCEIQLTRLVPPSVKNRSKRDFNTLLRDVIAKVRSVSSGATGMSGGRRRSSVTGEAVQGSGARSVGSDDVARRHRDALLSSEACGVARVDSENWTIVEANAQMARILHVAPANEDGVRRESDEIRANSGARMLRGKTLFDIVHPQSTPHLVQACNALMHTAAERSAPCKARTVGALSLQHDARLDCVPKLVTSGAPDEPSPIESCSLELIVCPALPQPVTAGPSAYALPESCRCTLLIVARPLSPHLPGTPSPGP